MDTSALLTALDALIADAPERHHEPGSGTQVRAADVANWVARAHTILAGAFPPRHAMLANFDRVAMRVEPYELIYVDRFDHVLGVVGAAASLVRAGLHRSIIEQVRTETVDEVLSAAERHLGAGEIVAAAVLAGGALETHLRHLFNRYGSLTIVGEGSIAKYDGAIAQARNAGTITTYGSPDSNQVKAWGGIRNEAAHDPTTFASKRTPAEIRLMIEGVRGFLARTS